MARMTEPRKSGLLPDRARRETGGHPGLQRQEQEQRRQRRSGHHVAPLDDILAEEGVEQ
ncbi:MAG TPA: hypothetical protein VGG57_12280 [Stellaceae bacterium]